MFRPFIASCVACALATLSIVPAVAAGHIVVQKTSPKGVQGVFLAHGLLPGHRYRLDVSASPRGNVSGYGNEFYIYSTKKQLYTGSKSLSFAGRAPRSFTVQQPINQKLSSWTISINVAVVGSKTMTAKLVDLGTH